MYKYCDQENNQIDFLFLRWVFLYKFNSKDNKTTCGAGPAFTPGAPEITLGFFFVVCCLVFICLCCVSVTVGLYSRSCFGVCQFAFDGTAANIFKHIIVKIPL